MVKGFTASFLAIFISGLIAILGGFVDVYLNQTALGVGFWGAGLAIIALGLALRSESILHETRRSEIDEKLAVMYAYQGKDAERVASDLEALIELVSSANDSQLVKISSEGRNLVAFLEARNLNAEAERVRTILVRVLAKRGLSF